MSERGFTDSAKSPLSWIAALLLAGCAIPEAHGDRTRSEFIRPEPEVLGQASNVGLAYIPALRKAEHGDHAALVQLINFSPQTDAAGALAHGWVLLELRRIVGPAEFSAALRHASEAGRESAARIMRVASTYR